MRVLIIGAANDQLDIAHIEAKRKGATVDREVTVDRALAALRAGRGADVVLADARDDIAGLIRSLQDERFHLPVIAYGIELDASVAVRAIRAGAQEFLPLPPDAELIQAMLEAVSESSSTIIASDPSMVAVVELARQIAPADASVLITGESGTGKEVMARFVHDNSRRKDKAFVSINCAAIPDHLLESELFGHEKGAFTGATARRVGKFEEADGGTLLLDEISEMDPRLQAKLLRALQEREIDRVGGSRPVKVNIRVLATSNRDLERAVAEGSFREDLLFRLNVVNLDLPPLRERPADLPALAAHFVTKHSEANGVAPRPLSEAAANKLRRHGWRGNVRELENCMHRAVLGARGDMIDEDAILFQGKTAKATPPVSGALVGQTVADVEQKLILDTLEHTLGNRTQAATILGISIRTLRNKLKQYGDMGLAVPPAENRI
ncbi:MAG: sigma-54-dependent transcriptional regulator [Geminicoccaceae bacterium]